MKKSSIDALLQKLTREVGEHTDSKTEQEHANSPGLKSIQSLVSEIRDIDASAEHCALEILWRSGKIDCMDEAIAHDKGLAKHCADSMMDLARGKLNAMTKMSDARGSDVCHNLRHAERWYEYGNILTPALQAEIRAGYKKAVCVIRRPNETVEALWNPGVPIDMGKINTLSDLEKLCAE